MGPRLFGGEASSQGPSLDRASCIIVLTAMRWPLRHARFPVIEKDVAFGLAGILKFFVRHGTLRNTYVAEFAPSRTSALKQKH